MSTIAFIGLGNMGGPMATNLVKAGHEVVGYDISAKALELAIAEGVKPADSARATVGGAEIVITMLPAGNHVLSVWPDILEEIQPGTLIIDSSTIDVDSARKAHAFSRERNCLSLDAPVSGGTVGATAASLTFMTGGSAEAFERAEPVLAKMGKSVFHCGDEGAGQSAKICNNLILGISMIGVAEGFALAEKLNLSHQSLFDVVSVSSGQCWSLTSWCPVPGPVPSSPSNNGYKPGFSAALMLKDLRLAQEAALSTGANTPLGAAAAQIYALFDSIGRGDDDFSSIINMVRGGEEKPT